MEENNIQQSSNNEPISTQPINSMPTKPKKGILKYVAIFLVAAIVSGGVATYAIFKNVDNTTKESNSTEARIPILRIATTEPINGYMFPDDNMSTVGYDAVKQAFDSLVQLQVGEIKPNLATSWSNSDSNTWLFTLRTDAKYPDGSTLTAADVVSSVEVARSNSYLTDFVSNIASIKALSDYQIELKTSTPDSLLLGKLDEFYITKKSATTGKYMGTGYFQIVENPTSTDLDTVGEINMIPNPNSYRKSIVDKLVFKFYESNDLALEAYKNSQVDFFEGGYSEEIKSMFTDAGAQVDSYDLAGVSLLLLGTDPNAKGLLGDINVRKAIDLALDREAIATAAVGAGTNSATSQLLSKSNIGYDSKQLEVKYDLVAAKKLLVGKDLSEEIVVTFRPGSKVGPVIIESLKQLGLKIKDNNFADTSQFIDYLSNTETKIDLGLCTTFSTSNEPTFIFSSLTGGCGGNRDTLKNTEFSTKLGSINSEFDPEKQIETFRSLNNFVFENKLAFPLFKPKYLLFTNPAYKINPAFYSTSFHARYFDTTIK
jgi:peptide/nickel transport system substrate-binding protein